MPLLTTTIRGYLKSDYRKLPNGFSIRDFLEKTRRDARLRPESLNDLKT